MVIVGGHAMWSGLKGTCWLGSCASASMLRVAGVFFTDSHSRRCYCSRCRVAGGSLAAGASLSFPASWRRRWEIGEGVVGEFEQCSVLDVNEVLLDACVP